MDVPSSGFALQGQLRGAESALLCFAAGEDTGEEAKRGFGGLSLE